MPRWERHIFGEFMDETKKIQPISVYRRLSAIIGEDLAIFCLCAVLDIPYKADVEADNWAEYAEKVTEGSFAEGETDVNNALLAGMDQEELWLTIWGEGYTDNDYRRLDELYRINTVQLDATGGVDAQQQQTARECAMMSLEVEKLLRGLSDREIPVEEKKNYSAVMKDLNKMISDKMKESEMRKSDIPRSAQQRYDGFVKQLEKQGLGVDMTEDQVVEWFLRKCDEKKYKRMTTDAADHAILSILQTLAKNNDTAVPMEIEEDMSLAAFEKEFAEAPNEQEKEVYDYLGITRGSAVCKGRDNAATLDEEDD